MKTVLLLLFLSTSVQVLLAQDSAVDSLRRVLETHQTNDTIRFRLLISTSDYLLSQPQECKKYIEQALDLAKDLGFEKGVLEAYCSLAYYYWDRMEYAQAIDYGLMALRGYENTDDARSLYDTYVILAGVYVSLKDFERATDYMTRMEELGKVNKDLVDYGQLYYNMGFLKLKQHKLEEGIAFINRSLSIARERNDHYLQASCYILMGRGHQEAEDARAALMAFENSIRAGRASEHPNKLANTATAHEGLGATLIVLKEFAKAALHLDTALQAAQQIKSANIIIKIYQDRARLHETQGNLKKALEFERLKNTLEDSVFNTEKSQQLADAQTRYDTEKKEQTISLLEKENEIKSLSRNLLLAGLSSVLVIGALIFYFQRQKNRRNQALLKKQEELNQKLREADHLKSRFFANISHEFRTPLTLILSPLEEKLSAADLSQKDKISFQSIRRSANRLLELINQLLEQSKLESGFMKLHQQPGKLYHFIMPILSSFDSLADVSQVRFLKEVRLPEVTVLLDTDKLEKILNNLLANAFKFTPPSGMVEIKVIAADHEGRTAMNIEVKNSGTIIPPDQLDKIFDPFFQGENVSSHHTPGTGLGLALVKELVKLYGGQIQVTSNASEGTIFAVTLLFDQSDKAADVPLERNIPETWTDIEISTENPSADTDASKEAVLIVEDNQEVRTLIRKGLEAQFNILEAATGKEGLQLVHENQVDLVISDVMMPVMNGVEFCHLLKNDEITSHIPVILLTARADHESRLEGLRTGADDYLVKPFNLQELQARINNLIEQRRKLIRKYNQRVVVHPHEITVTPLDEKFMQKIIHTIESNLDNTEFGVEKLTQELAMSRTNLHRKLKSITGMAVSEFIQDFRLRRAALLIEKKADSISQIAYQVGFNDQSYFTKCFKKKFGKTPSEFVPVSVEV